MKKIFDFGGNLMSLFLFQTCDMCLEQDDIFTFSTGKKVPKGQLSEADQKMCTRILFELYAKVRFLLELVSKELNHLAAILYVFAMGLDFMK